MTLPPLRNRQPHTEDLRLHPRFEPVSRRPWNTSTPPARVIVIRLHAVGDVAITLPGLVSLRSLLPDAHIDYLTLDTIAPLIESTRVVSRVLRFPLVTNRAARLLAAMKFGASARRQKYDLVIDLQRNWVTRLIRRSSMPKAWSEFDRFSSKPAAVRVLETLRYAGFHELTPSYQLPLQNQLLTSARAVLLRHNWNETERLILLNPAGLWSTRQWPPDAYVALANEWLIHEKIQLLFLGTSRIESVARYVQKRFRGHTINLTNATTLGEALSILQLVDGVVSEDSGLLHMAWASGIPTVALFGSTNHVWAEPQGDHSCSFNSGDLPCGACMKATCQFGDVRCLTRVSPECVLDTIRKLIAESAQRRRR